MSRGKKTRKGGENSPKLQPRTKKQERVLAGKKKETGNKSGSRHNEGQLQKQAPAGANAKKNDPRHGSKRPVALAIATQDVKTVTAKAKQPKLSDEQKLLQLEEDPRFNQLLDMLEEGRDLNEADQKWLDQQLNKVEALMIKLGITDDEETPAPSKKRPVSDDDLLDKFESGIDLLKDYQND